MSSLWFIVPAHGRVSLSAICLRQLRRTCDALTAEGIEATAVVMANDENLDTARALGFGTVERDNRFVSRRFNDGIQLACDPRYNPRPADYVVPCGSDDWIDYRILLELPRPATVLGFQHISFVREDGQEMTARYLNYPGGCGIRVYSRQIMAHLGYRPADEDRPRACDTSILVNVQRAYPALRIEHREIDPRQIVDWKSHGANLNPYESIDRRHRSRGSSDPFTELAEVFPADALEEMATHYARVLVPA
jgi:hypothetical protein